MTSSSRKSPNRLQNEAKLLLPPYTPKMTFPGKRFDPNTYIFTPFFYVAWQLAFHTMS